MATTPSSDSQSNLIPRRTVRVSVHLAAPTACALAIIAFVPGCKVVDLGDDFGPALGAATVSVSGTIDALKPLRDIDWLPHIGQIQGAANLYRPAPGSASLPSAGVHGPDAVERE